MLNKLRFALIALALAAVVGGAFQASALEYEVKIENMIPGGPEMGQPLTPPVVVVHGPGYSLFNVGVYATAGLEALAEDGVTADLVSEATASPDVYAVAVGGGPFFDMVTVQISGDAGDLLSLAAMLARSNDLFTGLHDVALPGSGSVVIDPTNVYDAGTEENTGLVEDIPFYGNSFVGPDEMQPISMISTYSVVNDPVYKMLDYEFPPSARITITVMDPTPTEKSTWGGIKDLFR
jgi:hypothetical protein